MKRSTGRYSPSWQFSVFRIQYASCGNVGIGISAPIYKLDVRGSINTDSIYRIGGSTVLSVKGIANSFEGINSGFSNTTGNYNTANGFQALFSNTTGNYNTANGYQALYSNTAGIYEYCRRV